MKEDLNNKVNENEDIIQAKEETKEEAKELFNELNLEQLEQVAGGNDGDMREDLSLRMVNNEYVAGEVDIDGWADTF